MVILSWCHSQRDMEVVRKVLQQVRAGVLGPLLQQARASRAGRGVKTPLHPCGQHAPRRLPRGSHSCTQIVCCKAAVLNPGLRFSVYT